MSVVELLASLTLAGGILLLLVLAIAALDRFHRNKWTGQAVAAFKYYGLPIAFIVALTATLGSLYLSEGLGWEPCKLCWFQRIFMYPLAVVYLVALIKNDKGAVIYAAPLALIGSLFSAYHYYIQMVPLSAGACSIVPGESCIETPFTYYGYITIPMMALTAFGLIIVFSIFGKLGNGQNSR